MSNGYIALHRKILDWEWWDDANTTRLFLYILLNTNHTAKKWRGIEIKKGEFLTSRDTLALKTGLSVQNVRTSLKRLKSTNELTIKTTKSYTLIKVVNWVNYQDKRNEVTKKVTKKLTNNQPTSNQQVTTTNNDNNVNKDNKDIYTKKFNLLYKTKQTLTKKRSAHLNARLKTYSMEQVVKALEVMYNIPFYRGINNDGWTPDLGFLIRSDDNVDKFLNKAKPQTEANKVRAPQEGDSPDLIYYEDGSIGFK